MLGHLSRDGFQKYSGGATDAVLKDFQTRLLLLRTMRQAEAPDKWLLADAEFADDTLIALGIVFLEVVEQATPLADQHEKPAA
jgi:hypothetical protein